MTQDELQAYAETYVASVPKHMMGCYGEEDIEEAYKAGYNHGVIGEFDFYE